MISSGGQDIGMSFDCCGVRTPQVTWRKKDDEMQKSMPLHCYFSLRGLKNMAGRFFCGDVYFIYSKSTDDIFAHLTKIQTAF